MPSILWSNAIKWKLSLLRVIGNESDCDCHWDWLLILWWRQKSETCIFFHHCLSFEACPNEQKIIRFSMMLFYYFVAVYLSLGRSFSLVFMVNAHWLAIPRYFCNLYQLQSMWVCLYVFDSVKRKTLRLNHV